MTPRVRLALIAASALALGACVTERVTPSRGVPLKPATRGQPQQRPVSSPTGTKAGLPPGAVAAPATGASSINSAVVVAIQPLGSVPSDGLVLPLVSPDGRFLATHRGEPPTWPTLLAQPGAESPGALTIEIYDLSASPPRRVEPAVPLPPGLVLGRTSTTRDFLVESLAPDGSRAVGRVRWSSGALEWLDSGDPHDVNAAFVEREGHPEIAAFISRTVTGTDSALHISVAGTDRSLAEVGSAFSFPLFTIDSARLFAFQQSNAGTDAVAISVSGDRAGRVTARRNLSASRDPWLAYQAAVAVQAAPAPLPGQGKIDSDRLLLFFHPGAGRMCLFDPNDASVLSLQEQSIAGCWARDAQGPIVLLTTPKGLIAQRVVYSSKKWTAGAPVRLLAESWVPRATTDADRPIVLIGPGRGSDAASVTIATLKLVPPEAAP
jgi:hypothetical protein